MCMVSLCGLRLVGVEAVRFRATVRLAQGLRGARVKIAPALEGRTEASGGVPRGCRGESFAILGPGSGGRRQLVVDAHQDADHRSRRAGSEVGFSEGFDDRLLPWQAVGLPIQDMRNVGQIGRASW